MQASLQTLAQWKERKLLLMLLLSFSDPIISRSRNLYSYHSQTYHLAQLIMLIGLPLWAAVQHCDMSVCIVAGSCWSEVEIWAPNISQLAYA